MKHAAFEVEVRSRAALACCAVTELSKVLNSLGDCVAEETENDTALLLASNLDIKENFLRDSVESLALAMAIVT